MEFTEKEYSQDKYGQTKLIFNMVGLDINYCLVNSLKRCVQTYVPIIAYYDIKISDNDSVFKDDILKIRLTNLLVPTRLNTREIMKHYKYNEELNFYKIPMPTKEHPVEKTDNIDLFDTEEPQEDKNYDNIKTIIFLLTFCSQDP